MEESPPPEGHQSENPQPHPGSDPNHGEWGDTKPLTRESELGPGESYWWERGDFAQEEDTRRKAHSLTSPSSRPDRVETDADFVKGHVSHHQVLLRPEEIMFDSGSDSLVGRTLRAARGIAGRVVSGVRSFIRNMT